ncbi:glycosyltransferase family 4 protein [Terribacillus saccharophilus]|uniref:glycosyltransferase family 4 protein n=1 Tax=Terribacillus saccharophilus TaxID=361277 RepID=UPI003D2D36A4
MKIKIAYICEALGGGVSRHLLDLMYNIDKEKYEISLIYNLDRADNLFIASIKDLKKLGVKFHPVKKFNREITVYDIKALYEITKEIKAIKPDIIHCHSSKAGALGRLAGKLAGVNKIIYTPHAYMTQDEDLSMLKKKLFNGIEKILLNFTKYTINVSNGEKDFAIKTGIGNQKKNVVIYNGARLITSLDKKKIMNELSLKPNDYVIGYVARLEEQKDPIEFVNIAREVVHEFPHCKFIFLGDGSLKAKIESFIKENRLEKNVILLGYKQNVSDYLGVFNLYLTTAKYEGMPYSLIEALQYKLPIIGTDVTGNNEVIKHMSNGFLYERGENTRAIDYIKKIIMNKEMYSCMSNESYKLFLENFTLEKMIRETENLYKKVEGEA